MNLTGNEAVSYSGVYGLTIGDNVVPLTAGNDFPCGDFYHNYYQPYFIQWYPNIYSCYPNRIEQAFKVASKLMETKIISNDLNIKDFLKLVNDIAEVL